MRPLKQKNHLNRSSSSAPRITIFGIHSADWTEALGNDAAVWSRLGVQSIQTLPGYAIDAPNVLVQLGNSVLIPLMEPHIRNCPRVGYGLFPDRDAVDLFANKKTFADYALRNGLADMCPRDYGNTEAHYPCVLKRIDLNAGIGVEIVHNQAELKSLLNQPMWAGHDYIVQEYVASDSDFVTHMVCRNGKIKWHCTYQLFINPPGGIQQPGNTVLRSPIIISEDVLERLNRFLLPLKYNGPVNFDYKIDHTGAVKVMEINPRLGGSLMVPENIDDLEAALRCIIKNAVTPAARLRNIARRLRRKAGSLKRRVLAGLAKNN